MPDQLDPDNQAGNTDPNDQPKSDDTPEGWGHFGSYGGFEVRVFTDDDGDLIGFQVEGPNGLRNFTSESEAYDYIDLTNAETHAETTANEYSALLRDIASGQNELASAMASVGLTQASIAKERLNFEKEVSRIQLGWAKEIHDLGMPVLTKFMKESSIGKPVEPAIASARADVTRSLDISKQQAEMQMQSQGIDPSSAAYQARLGDIDRARTQALVGATQGARAQTEGQNWARKQYAAGIAAGMPSEAASTAASAAGMQSGGLAGLSGAGSTLGGALSGYGAAANTVGAGYGAVLQGYQQQGAYAQQRGIGAQQYGYQSALSRQDYEQQEALQPNPWMQAFTTIGGQALGRAVGNWTS